MQNLRFSPDGRSFAAITINSALEAGVMVLDLVTGQQLVDESLRGYAQGAKLTYTPDGRSLVVGSKSGPAAQVRDVRTGRLLQSLSLDVSGSSDLAIRPADGRLLSINGEDLREWDLPPAEPRSLDTGKVIETAGIVKLTCCGRHLVAQPRSSDPSKPGEFVVEDVSTGRILRKFPSQESGTVLDQNSQIGATRSTSAGTRLASIIGSPVPGTLWNVAGTGLRIWDLTTGRQILNLDIDLLGGVAAFQDGLSNQAWDDTGKRIALAVQHGDRGPDRKIVSRREWSVTIVDVPSGQIVRTIPMGTRSCIPSFRPDGELLAIATTVVTGDGASARVDLVEPDSGRILRTLSGKLPSVGRVIFSPDGRRLVAASSASDGDDLRGAILIWDLSPGAPSKPVRLGGIDHDIKALAISPDGRRLASGTRARSLFNAGELRLWDTASGRDLATWNISNGVPQDLAFDGEGWQLRAAILTVPRGEIRVMLLDASPLAPEIEAVDLVNRLRGDVPLNAELAAKVEAEPGLEPAVRAAALAMVSARVESPDSLLGQALSSLQLPGPERTPALLRRALAHGEQAMRLMDNPSSYYLRVLGDARYRNGLFAEALESLRKAEARGNEDTQRDRELPAKIQVLIAMAQAKLGHRAEAEAALANYRRLWSEANPKATTPPPLEDEAENVLSEAFKTGDGSKSPTNRR
jgi:WD40 repeat protein